MPTFESTRRGYGNLWRSIDYGKPGLSKDQIVAQIDAVIGRGLANRSRYETIMNLTGVPWAFVLALHNRESSLNLSTHLHNGDSLSDYTTHVPAGRPQVGHPPPFTWVESAVDALKMRALDKVERWSIERMLYEAEAYNGWAYFGHLASPYVWAFSSHYAGGKILRDHGPIENVYDPQLGVAILLYRMQERELITLTQETTPMPTTPAVPTIDLAAIDHTFDTIKPFLPILGNFIPAAVPIVTLLEDLLHAAAAIQKGGNLYEVIPTALRAIADQVEALKPK